MKACRIRWQAGLIVALALCHLANIREQAAGSEIKITVDRADGMYQLGEEATFHISVDGADEKDCVVCLSNDGYKVIYQGPIKLQDGKGTLRGTLREPGILRCRVNSPDGKRWGIAAAAFEPLRIQPSMPKPDDFDEFWSLQKARLAQVSWNVQIHAEPSAVKEGDAFTVWSISLANIGGTRIRGYLAKPTGAGPFPAVLVLQNHGGGAWSVPREWVTNFAGKGFLAMAINSHDVENGREEDYYRRLNEGPLASYTLRGFMNRETYYFKRMYLSIVRSIDYLVSLPEWDQKSLILTGRSQGGGLSLVGAGLDPRVTGLVAAVPALCEHSGPAFGRPAGWPRLVPNDEHDYGDAPNYAPTGDGHSSPSKVVLNVARYYDAVNFARNIKCPAVIALGLVDRACPPTTVYSAYNVLTSSKTLVVAPMLGHDADKNPEYRRDARIIEFARRSGSRVRE